MGAPVWPCLVDTQIGHALTARGNAASDVQDVRWGFANNAPARGQGGSSSRKSAPSPGSHCPWSFARPHALPTSSWPPWNPEGVGAGWGGEGRPKNLAHVAVAQGHDIPHLVGWHCWQCCWHRQQTAGRDQLPHCPSASFPHPPPPPGRPSHSLADRTLQALAVPRVSRS